MADGKYDIVEVRINVEDPEITQVYILIKGDQNCPHTVNGWHHKTFAASMSMLNIMHNWADGEEQPIMWPLKAPENK